MERQYIGHVQIPLPRVHIELTNMCNFDCVFCPQSEMRRPYGHMDTGLAKRIISQIGVKNIAEKITFHVMGEPTLHPRFFEILDHARDEGVKVGLTTNGSRLGGATGQRLGRYPLHQIDISLQTPDAQCYTLRNAGRLPFDTYLNGILEFFAAYKGQPNPTIFKFRFLNTRFRQKHMEARQGPIDVISSTRQLRQTFAAWANRIYDILEVDADRRANAMREIRKLVAYKWNVVEIYPTIFFETYMLKDWGHAFGQGKVRDAWAGYCFGMRDHFSILHNGDVALCCVDFDGHTAIGNLHRSSLEEILAEKRLGEIINAFKRYRVIHPYCKHCLGSRSFASWLYKPLASILALKTLKPFFYQHTQLYRD